MSRSPVTRGREAVDTFGRDGSSASGPVNLAVGRMLVDDALHGIEHPTDSWRHRPGIVGSVLGIVVASIFIAIPSVMIFFLLGGTASTEPAGPFAQESFADDGPPKALLIVPGLFLLIGLGLLLSTLVTLIGRVRSLFVGRGLIAKGERLIGHHAPGNPAIPPADPAVAEAVRKATEYVVSGLAFSTPSRYRHGSSLHRGHSSSGFGHAGHDHASDGFGGFSSSSDSGPSGSSD